MKVWYIADKYNDVLYPDDDTFYATEELAAKAWYELENNAKIVFYKNQERRREQWETDELVVQSCEELGINWKKGRLMYHRREWEDHDWTPSTVVKSIEVVEE